MARRARIGGDDGDYAAFLASRQQQQTDPRMAMAMQIMDLMDKSAERAAEARHWMSGSRRALRSIRRGSWVLSS